MNDFSLPRSTQIPPSAGKLLIAEPFLYETVFSRSVVLLCSHDEEGSMGLILNKPVGSTLNDLLQDERIAPAPIYLGGPVQPDTLHMIHTNPDTLGGEVILPGVYWGGNYTLLSSLHQENEAFTHMHIRFFVGYSGWSPGQLEEELKQGSWLVAEADLSLIFHTPVEDLWKNAILSLGAPFSLLANLPTHPQLN